MQTLHFKFSEIGNGVFPSLPSIEYNLKETSELDLLSMFVTSRPLSDNLPEGIEMRRDNDGKPYYANHNTRSTTRDFSLPHGWEKSDETRSLTRELDKLNKEIKCLRFRSFENAPDFAQSTPISHATRPRQSKYGIASVKIPDRDFGTGSNIPQSTHIGVGAKSKVMSQPVITDKHIPASVKLTPEMRTFSDSVLEKNIVTERRKKDMPKLPDEIRAYRGDNSIHKSKNIIKPATFDGKGSLIDYKSHFDACSNINGWTDVEKVLYLAISLRGQAQEVLGNLPTNKRQNFKELVRSLEERFSPANQTELYRTQLRERRQKAS
ncbi:Hypothetical predicted protein [Mytilus galloprovincialis]|uniref:WW domain-containing protein n=1 Tax=Mytilus galloprovincialis TaxID=29158 RepID=A0A8B6FYJ1_MYTGA|nr:Hypothetical predicted protein [Mytilus galloprovincialis]